MRIDYLHLKNFKCYKDETFHFNAGFTLVIGKNGSGKTAILDALTVAAGTLFLKFDNNAKTRPIAKSDIRLQPTQAGDYVTMETQVPVEVEAGGQVNGGVIKWTRSVQSAKKPNTTYRHAREMKLASEALQIKVMKGEDVVLPLVTYFGTGRLWLKKQETSAFQSDAGSRFMGYQNCLDPASNEKNFIRWFNAMEFTDFQRERSGQGPSKLFAGVKATIVRSVRNCTHFYYNGKSKSICARFKDGRDLPLENFSDGERNMIGMVADMAYRAAILNPMFGEEAGLLTPGLVLIDEIGLHLHPEWQQTVVADLKQAFPKVQFIATSHSPFIIQSLNPAEDSIIPLDEMQWTPRANTSELGVEEIAEEWQGVAVPQRSRAYLEKIDAAEEYLTVLAEGEGATGKVRRELIVRLDKLMKDMERSGNDPAYQAALRLERKAAGLWE